MKIYRYNTLLDENRQPFLKEDGIAYHVDGRKRYDSPLLVRDFAVNVLDMDKMAEEYVFLLCLDHKYHLTGLAEVSHGTVNKSLVSPREVFQKALLLGACHIIIIHNHPTGDASPSQNDIDITKNLNEAGHVIGINLQDHIIIGKNEYYAFSEKR